MYGLRASGESTYNGFRLLPQDLQVVLFSATFPDYVIQYAKNFAPKANEITLKHEELTIEGIKQLYLECNQKDKYDVLVRLYGLMTIGSSIIFVKVYKRSAFIPFLGLRSIDA